MSSVYSKDKGDVGTVTLSHDPHLHYVIVVILDTIYTNLLSW